MINSQRMSERFTKLCEIDSLSRQERDVALEIEKILSSMGAEISYDTAGKQLGGNCSNLIAKFRGTVDVPSLFLCAHMDTVGPGEGIKVKFQDGEFKSKGATILGADDKSAIAIILEVMNIIFENTIDYPPVEIIFTVCEEIGLLGAKNLDYSMIKSKFGYVLDSTDTEGIVTRAPATVKIIARIYGKSAHAGAEPEKGINAILIAAKAISKINPGRLDSETTCNIGIIKGGIATNIVPDFVEIHGEARSHNAEKLKNVIQNISNTFHDTISEFKTTDAEPRLELIIEDDFPATKIPEEHQVIQLAKKAAENLNMSMINKSIGGGSDANIFFSKGIMGGVIGTGMTDVHTTNESVHIRDMENCTRLLIEILKLHAVKQ
ncbi:MAG: M20/M25/M40 family metallo-hydrolase [Desulfobacula sp.]|jgi:tripeptide aminopeptidase|nr:M20/M25/M40 family metallo-hydrolase [Desulfobacula sp.]